MPSLLLRVLVLGPSLPGPHQQHPLSKSGMSDKKLSVKKVQGTEESRDDSRLRSPQREGWRTPSFFADPAYAYLMSGQSVFWTHAVFLLTVVTDLHLNQGRL